MNEQFKATQNSLYSPTLKAITPDSIDGVLDTKILDDKLFTTEEYELTDKKRDDKAITKMDKDQIAKEPIGSKAPQVSNIVKEGSGRIGRMGGPYNDGPGGSCICPKCQTLINHTSGKPCKTMKCPVDGTTLLRKDIYDKQNKNKKEYIQEAFFGLISVPIVDEIVGTIQDTAEAAIKGVGKTIETTGRAIKGGADIVQGKIGSGVSKIAGASEKVIRKSPDSIKQDGAFMKFLKDNKNSAWIAAGLLSTGLLATLGARVYKAYFTKAAKACAGKPDKINCIKQFKIKTIKGIISSLTKSKSSYNSLPPKYKMKAVSRVEKEIAKQKSKLYKIASN